MAASHLVVAMESGSPTNMAGCILSGKTSLILSEVYNPYSVATLYPRQGYLRRPPFNNSFNDQVAGRGRAKVMNVCQR